MSGAPGEASGGPMAERLAALVADFAEVGETQMRDLPVYNRNVEIETMGFRPYCADYLGVLIAPWFISVVALPRVWAPERAGTGQASHFLPSGPEVFLEAFSEKIGAYASLSLVTALFHIHSQDDARKEAREGLVKLMTPVAAGRAKKQTAMSRRDLFRGRVR
ncbi:[NiFe]-hydrogenase assembly chaperone HybE [Rhodobium gokarnense]|uniref:[NiFe] hydrogenase assembly HybE family chaperone n=1 Tax=Rhodobium gokarnense TaxID=364296 RepID=A0ABT3HIC0_9HYPH|nr:[NiFe]-hydrogenase assembly chaperone HybE [Rhodobium gokarnense]MCW2310127.1 [NiFe] hydrogenase assembly HybE family chaperone [Rhodobium gokarnense]